MDDDNVHIIVHDPCNPGIFLYEIYFSKLLLCKIPLFKSWFDAVEVYQDYIELGNESYSGVSNLMFFDKNDKCPYVLEINCDHCAHDLGMYTPPVIVDIINYCTYGTKPSDDKRLIIFQKYFT